VTDPSASRSSGAAGGAVRASGESASAGGGAHEKPYTLAIDIGGTGLKASVLDKAGQMVEDRVRVATRHPCPPQAMVDALVKLVQPLASFDRISAGFPGVVREGKIRTAPHFVTKSGPGSAVQPELLAAWRDFDLAGALASSLGKPCRVANDADLQGAAVVKGSGLELVVTLGTGVGTGLFDQGRLAPHLEIAHHPFRKGQTYNEQLGDEALNEIGEKKWNKRVKKAIECLHSLLNYDHCYIGGGNSRHVSVDLGRDVSLVDNSAGILGGIWLWDPARGME